MFRIWFRNPTTHNTLQDLYRIISGSQSANDEASFSICVTLASLYLFIYFFFSTFQFEFRQIYIWILDMFIFLWANECISIFDYIITWPKPLKSFLTECYTHIFLLWFLFILLHHFDRWNGWIDRKSNWYYANLA